MYLYLSTGACLHMRLHVCFCCHVCCFPFSLVFYYSTLQMVFVFVCVGCGSAAKVFTKIGIVTETEDIQMAPYFVIIAMAKKDLP